MPIVINDSSMPNVDKIGNLIIYLVDEIKRRHLQPLYLTKLLKLLYIIDETSVKETGVSVTGLEYRVWKMGPVAYDVYKDLKHENSDQLSSFAEAKTGGDSAQIKSVNKFNDSEFSDYEMELIDRVIDEYGYYQKDELIKLLHEEGSLWCDIVKAKGLEELFKTENTSVHRIDFKEILKNDPQKLTAYKTAQASRKL